MFWHFFGLIFRQKILFALYLQSTCFVSLRYRFCGVFNGLEVSKRIGIFGSFCEAVLVSQTPYNLA